MPAESSALIGHTGFVGSNLAAATDFTDYFNSKNIEEIRQRSFNLVVCAGVAAVKWRANQDPDEDLAAIERLLAPLRTINAERFVLISTVDVYPNPCGVDEATDPHGTANHAYGSHRLMIEDFVREYFKNHHIVRLPGLFGPGLKKNVIYDLLHAHQLDVINPASEFQYYNLARLWSDLQEIITRRLPLVNLATEPLATATIIERFFSSLLVGCAPSPFSRYDMRTRYADLRDHSGCYLYSAKEILEDLGQFIAGERQPA
ncbi:MAG: NAD-dependent epimerase/dehydratase family protein [Kiritimatiellia bacterium]|nr:NAD-dependent epimerase/dehydratase family protein [Lentisphaerota bacterium]